VLLAHHKRGLIALVEICNPLRIKPGDTLLVSLTDHEMMVKKKG
jgi:hypothetical protein